MKKNKLSIASWNVRTLLDLAETPDRPHRRTALVALELARYDIDIAALSETRLHGEDSLTEVGAGYTFFWKGVPEGIRRNHGVGFAVKSKLLQRIPETPIGINERLMTWRIPLAKERFATLISAYAPTLDAEYNIKEGFYRALDAILQKTPATDRIILMGDFNARVGSEHMVWSKVIGQHGVGKMNRNGLRLLSLCAEHQLVITNTIFQMKNWLKTTWQHPRSKHWHLLDYVIVRQKDRRDVLTTRVMRGAECWTDHLMVRSKLLMSIQPRVPRRVPNKKLNCTALNNLTIKDNLRRLLAENLNMIPEESADWPALRQAIHNAASEALGQSRKHHQDWFDCNSAEIQSLLKTKHEAHKALLSCPGSPTHKATFTAARAETQRALRTMENIWWVKKAHEIQNLADCNNTQGFYDAIKALYGPRKRVIAPVRSAEGSTLFKDRHEILARWVNHFENLFNHTNPVDQHILDNLPDLPPTMHLDTPPLFSELRQAISGLKNNKSAGPDGIPAEVFKHGGYTLTRRLHLLIQNIWEHGTLPQDWKDANIVVIYKQKGDRAVCGNSRGISLLSIAGKVLAKIMLSRLVEHISETVLPETQCGFRKTRSTTDMVFVLRQLLEKSREHHKDLFVAFIDLSKAFDTINRELLWKHLSKIGVPPKFLSILQQLHDGMQARVLMGELQSESFGVNVGVKQGCVLAPMLFNILLSAITCLFHRVLGHEDGVHVEYRLDGSLFNIRRLQAHTKTKIRQICELQYADDCAILAHSPDSMQYALNIISSLYQSFGLQVNTQKTEVMFHLTTPVPAPPSFHINGVPLKSVDHFTYLGSTLSSSSSLDTEIHTRINKASSSFGRLRSRVFENRNLKVSTKVAVYNAVCLSTLLYGAESWTPYRQHIIHLEAFHIRCLQKILSLSWKDRIPQTVILSNTDSICMEAAVARKHLRWIGHTIRMPEHRLPRQVLYSQLVGAKRSAGGQKRRFKDYTRDLLKRANIPLTKLESLALDRSAWQATCAAAVSQIHQTNQDQRSMRRIKRHQRAAGTPLVSGFPCSICGRVCGSRIGLYAHEKWHQRHGC